MDMNETVNFILDEVRTSINAENGSIMLLDDDETTLKIIAAFGSNPDMKTELKVGSGIAGDVLNTGRIELINDVSVDSRFKPGDMNFNALMCAPLITRDKKFGVINLSNSAGNLFNGEDMRCMRVLSIYASIAIDNARLFSETDRLKDSIIKHATLLDMA